MPSITSGPAFLSWDPATRLMELRATAPGSRVDGPAARALRAQAAEWIGPDPAPFTILVDVGDVADVDAEWRAEWAAFFRERRDLVTLAYYNANALLRVIIRMFLLGTRVHGRVFESESEARAWLAAQGGRRVAP